MHIDLERPRYQAVEARAPTIYQSIAYELQVGHVPSRTQIEKLVFLQALIQVREGESSGATFDRVHQYL